MSYNLNGYLWESSLLMCIKLILSVAENHKISQANFLSFQAKFNDVTIPFVFIIQRV